MKIKFLEKNSQNNIEAELSVRNSELVLQLEFLKSEIARL